MKKIFILILVLTSFCSISQVNDTTPQMDYVIITDSVGFIRAEYFLRTTLEKYDSCDYVNWCRPLKNMINKEIYGCEVPDTCHIKGIKLSRLEKIQWLVELGKVNVSDYEFCYQYLQLVNRKEFYIDENFKDFKK